MLDFGASVTPDSLHRTAKYFMDTGRATSYQEAVGMLRGYGLSVRVGDEVKASRDHQLALLTLVNVTRRTLLGGVVVESCPDVPLLVPVAEAVTLLDAVTQLGGRCSESVIGCGQPVA